MPRAPADDSSAQGERVLHALALTRVGVWEVDAEERTTFVDEIVAAMLGYRAEEMLGCPLESFMEAGTALANRWHRPRRRSGLSDVREARLIHREGREVWVLASAAPILDDDGVFRGAVATIVDITAQKAAKGLAPPRPVADRLPAEQAAPHGTWVLDLDTGNLFWSHDVYEMFGVLPGRFRPSYPDVLELVHPHDQPLIRRSLELTMVDRKAFSVYFRAVHPSGAVRVLYADAGLSGSQSAARLAGRIDDVTELVENARTVTAREREVLDLVAQGLTTAEVGRRLQISPETVRTHIQHATSKLNAHNRVHAVVLALRMGEIRL